MIIAKNLTGPEVKSQERFELFEIKTMKDVNDKNVNIPVSIGTYTLMQLTKEKEDVLARVAVIDERIKAINDLIAGK